MERADGSTGDSTAGVVAPTPGSNRPEGRLAPNRDVIGEALTSRYVAIRRLAAVAADSDIEPDDVVHEVFARVVARWHATGLPDGPDAYLRRAVMNHVRNERRTRARGRAAAAKVGASAVPAETGHLGYPSDVDALLESLAPEDRTLVYLVDVEGLPARVAADAVGLSAVAARSRLSRARRRLRTIVAALDRDEGEDAP